MNNDSKNQPCVLDKLKSQIDRGRKLLERPSLKAGQIKVWQIPVRRQLASIFGTDSQTVNAFNLRIADVGGDLAALLNEKIRFIEQLTLNLENAPNVGVPGTIDGVPRIFLGHGRNQVWSSIYTFIGLSPLVKTMHFSARL